MLRGPSQPVIIDPVRYSGSPLIASGLSTSPSKHDLFRLIVISSRFPFIYYFISTRNGRPSACGRDSLAQQARDTFPSTWVTFEMRPSNLAGRVVCRLPDFGPPRELIAHKQSWHAREPKQSKRGDDTSEVYLSHNVRGSQ